MRTLQLTATLSVGIVLVSNAATLWRDPGPIGSLDLAGGPGGQQKAPRPPFVFVEEEQGGTSAKVIVKDARGAKWAVKFGEEAKAENFAARIAWAAGYYADPTYFVRDGRIRGVGSLGRAAKFIDQGTGAFKGARFELWDETVHVPGSNWKLNDSELRGSRELSGLKILFGLLSNWDVKPQNLAVVRAGGKQMYAVTDWGATMGRAGDFSGRSKWDCAGYTADTEHLVQDVENGFVTVRYDGKDRNEVLRGVKVEDVQWLMQRLGGLSDAQIRSALEASGATPDELACFAKAFRSRLDQLKNVREHSSDTVVTKTRREIRIIRKVPEAAPAAK